MNMNIGAVVSQLRKYKGWWIAVSALTLIFSTSTVAWLLIVNEQQSPIASVSNTGWGREAVVGVRGYVAEFSPIADANACGMGASSCFKCHNGMRAVAPKMDAKTAPWHVDHKSVDGDCVGCHKGNERLIKKELAHTGLIKDPRVNMAGSCDSCHKSGNTADLNARYKK